MLKWNLSLLLSVVGFNQMSDGFKCSIMFLFDISCWVWIRMSFERKCMSHSKRIYLKERIIFLQACGQMLGNQWRSVSHPGTNPHRQELLPLAWDVSKRKLCVWSLMMSDVKGKLYRRYGPRGVKTLQP